MPIFQSKTAAFVILYGSADFVLLRGLAVLFCFLDQLPIFLSESAVTVQLSESAVSVPLSGSTVFFCYRDQLFSVPLSGSVVFRSDNEISCQLLALRITCFRLV